MLRIMPSKDERVLAVEFDGKAAGEDAAVLDAHVNEKFGDREFNVLAVIRDVDGSTLKGLVEGMKFDAKKWKQFQKFAVVGDKNWIKAAASVGNLLPGIEAKHFNMDETEEAWSWLRS
ncbi:SpoIIAA family protein [Bacillus massiliglaciei]|uniref:STAS/SEC14 domain-containing protein n=1 Tax=Bacillus massiliglaciei TaxID=1816693 RepID=UPI000DA5F41D|nr:STAS/SEC14 domain-containing protein [Bacillus massiliglaciei]